MNLHTQDEKIVREFAVKPASRILVNTGGSMGGTGLSTGLAPAFTLGCGTMGGSSVRVFPLPLLSNAHDDWKYLPEPILFLHLPAVRRSRRISQIQLPSKIAQE